MKYRTLLRDPRWQKRRLQIFEHDDWRCQQCGATERELQVHHRWYQRGAAPWESPEEALLTLCVSCHKEREMRQGILTAAGRLAPCPVLSDKRDYRAGTDVVRAAYGDNGHWYYSIDDLEEVGERLCAELFQPMVRFRTFVTTEERGIEARKRWNARLGPMREPHVHFHTQQPGYQGTWAIDDLGQTYATFLDPSFDMHVQSTYRQATSDRRHADEPAAKATVPASAAHLTTVDVRGIGAALMALADNQEALKAQVAAVEVQVIKVEEHVSTVSENLAVVTGRVEDLEQHQGGLPLPPRGWLTVALFLKARGIVLARGGEFKTFNAFVREAMGPPPVHIPRPNHPWPDTFYHPDILQHAWTRYQRENPRLF